MTLLDIYKELAELRRYLQSVLEKFSWWSHQWMETNDGTRHPTLASSGQLTEVLQSHLADIQFCTLG